MKVVVAYSGGLDTSVIVKWVKETYNAEVICYCADVGQEEELEGLDKKAIATGASKCYIDDIREEFARDFIFPMMQANAIYEGTYLLGTSIARPLIAKRLVEVAKAEGADAICHGATGKGNDQVRFELSANAIDPSIKVIAAWRDPKWCFKGRLDMIEYAKKNNIPVSVSAKKPYSMDRNLLHISFEGGILEDPWQEFPEDIAVMTEPLSKAADAPERPETAPLTWEWKMPTVWNKDGYQTTTDRYIGFLTLNADNSESSLAIDRASEWGRSGIRYMREAGSDVHFTSLDGSWQNELSVSLEDAQRMAEEKLHEMGLRGREWVKANLDWSKVGEMMREKIAALCHE